jgi:hypothetical protein
MPDIVTIQATSDVTVTGPAAVQVVDVGYALPGSAGSVALAGDLGNTVFVPEVISTHLASPLPAGQGGAGTVSPMTYGAVFNGSTDDSAALNTAITRGGTIQFPPGTTVVNAAQLNFRSSNLHIRGAGMYDTVVQCTSGSLSSLWVYGSSFVSTVELSDMTLDGTGVSVSAVATLGNRLDRLRIRRVRFVNWPAVIIQSGYAAETIVEDCEADGAGLGLGTFFLSTNRQNESIILRRNRLRWLNTGITIGSGNPTAAQYHSAYIDISDNYIDLGWWLLKTVSSGSGGTVTYTASTVTDTAASFGTIAAGTTIRVLTPLQTGTLTTIGTQVTDASANFIGSNVWRGHIVRSGTAFAVVSLVESATQLHVEEWLSQATYQPVTPPSAASYTIYGVTLGARVSNTSTSITIAHGGGGNGGNWYDLRGNEVTPAAGTLYEVLPAHPVYPVFCNIPVEKVKIHGNTIRRGWGDGIEFFGSRGIITGNIVEDGQDEGIVCQGLSVANPGVKNIVANNICRHNGTSGLDVIYQSDCEIGPNQLEDNTWGDPSGLNIGQLQLVSCVNTTVTGGRSASGSGSVINQAGLVISGSETSGIKVTGFSGHGAAAGDVYIASTVPAGACDLLDIDGVIAYQGASNGQRTRVKGTGAPALIASPGSQFLRTDGGIGATLYIKETASTSRGWVAYGAGGSLGGQAAYAVITASVSQVLTASTWTAISGAPSITLPNDGNTYRVKLSGPGAQISTAATAYVSLGTSPTGILATNLANYFQAATPYPNAECEAQKVTGSGQVITVYGFCASAFTLTLVAGAGGTSAGPCELAAYRVA